MNSLLDIVEFEKVGDGYEHETAHYAVQIYPINIKEDWDYVDAAVELDVIPDKDYEDVVDIPDIDIWAVEDPYNKDFFASESEAWVDVEERLDNFYSHLATELVEEFMEDRAGSLMSLFSGLPEEYIADMTTNEMFQIVRNNMIYGHQLSDELVDWLIDSYNTLIGRGDQILKWLKDEYAAS